MFNSSSVERLGRGYRPPHSRLARRLPGPVPVPGGHPLGLPDSLPVHAASLRRLDPERALGPHVGRLSRVHSEIRQGRRQGRQAPQLQGRRLRAGGRGGAATRTQGVRGVSLLLFSEFVRGIRVK